MSHPPRIAILGMALEANRNAPVTTRQNFEDELLIDGDELARELAGDRARLPATVRGFCVAMDDAGPWTPIPILLAEAPPGGPIDQAFFSELLATFSAGLTQAGVLDGVFISEHGAALSTELDDADGEVFAIVRSAVGSQVPIVATLDLHGHVTPRMNASVDVMIAYRTNPHVDMAERGAEAAAVILEMCAGMRPHSALLRVPMISPATSLLTGCGPYADLLGYGQSRKGPNIVNVSILAGFAPADATTNGLSVLVTARDSAASARTLACELAVHAWSDRHRYTSALTGLEDAISLAADVCSNLSKAPVLLADVADNPGAGGRGNTMYLLSALHKKGLTGVVIGMIFDASLAAQAHSIGANRRFTAHFNRDEVTKYSERFVGDVLIERLIDGECVGRRGMFAGRRMNLGPCALLNLDGIRIVVVSRRHQCADPVFIERLGVDLSATRILVLKSRGHFRAGFDEFFRPEQIIEVDAPGLTTPVIPRLQLSRVVRPVFPLDTEMIWAPSA